ncbi:LacI family DNA-binding transcriptional regulator [Oricola cellulosilytica]|uniref:LacI family DNA-binding transcriptional regulator n=1 Tax=Oricola cellulosilytica TaxID=1429082 RepID=A0A4R0P392_9HYPH|nr:LacI family DNA-binding transcriptional regulator [Oricola cellulosilytica]TCD11313.1 LacI family DNA-binding transcriptional regulator [Oricola cellulosilytica]
MVRDRILPLISDTQRRTEWADAAGLPPDAFHTFINWRGPEDRVERDHLVFSLVERAEIGDGRAKLILNPDYLMRHILGQDRLPEPRAINTHVIDLSDPILAYRSDAPKHRIIHRTQTPCNRRENGRRWFALLATGKAKDMYEIATAHGVSQSTVSRAIAEALEI